MNRPQKALIEKDLQKKMVFLVGPRQAGKTWLAKSLMEAEPLSLYLNYDQLQDRAIIQNQAWLDKTQLLILDELHKMPDWKQYLKGVFDTKPNHLKILVTGSARLDTFRQGGDSLAGRFFLHRLLPFSPAELNGTPFSTQLDRFMERGGFPEPFLADDLEYAKRWQMQYLDGLIQDDILNFEPIQNLKAIKLVLTLLRNRVGSPVSYSSLAQDIGISPNTVKKYIDILEALYIVFRVTPFATNVARSILKEPKIYFFDTAMVQGDEGAKFENMMAVCLLKHVYAEVDYSGKRMDLHYLRTKDRLEVDFCLTQDNQPELMIEAKLSDDTYHKPLFSFHEKTGIPGKQVVLNLRQERKEKAIEVVSGLSFLQGLRL